MKWKTQFFLRKYRMCFMNKELKVKIIKNANLKDFCTFKIGGSADFAFVVENTYSLIKFCKVCKEIGVRFKVIGLGANLLFSDDGFNGGIIVNRSNSIKFKGKSVFADSGVHVSSLIQKCITRNLGGIENLMGIPATIGGAVVNSLSAFNTNFTDFVEHVICYDIENDKIIKLTAKECEFGYRTSVFKHNNLVVLQVKIKLNHCNALTIEENAVNAVQRKKLSQPLNMPSAGSVFKRGEDFIPSLIIDKLGLKGERIGDAQISTKHAGFIVNLGSATAEDVKKLIDYIKNEVRSSTGNELETEIEFVD